MRWSVRRYAAGARDFAAFSASRASSTADGSPAVRQDTAIVLRAQGGKVTVNGNGFGRRALLGGAAMLGIAPAARQARAQDETIRIGVLTDENGPYRDSGGAGAVLAVRMAVKDFGGSVLGKSVEIVHADTQNKPDVAAAIARQWYDSGVDAVTDLPVTSVAAAVQQVAREKGRTVMITASAVTEFTSKWCSPVSSHWADDTHAMAHVASTILTRAGGKTWFFITVDFSFGHRLQAEATEVIAANGGKVVGTAKFPIGNTDFSSQIVQAQSSGAKVIGLVSVGNDQVNLIKQAAEFGLRKSGAELAGFLVYITDIHALGLAAAQGLTFAASYYWDQSEPARAFARRFAAERNAMPTKNQATIYAATLHFLKAMAQSGTRDALAVNKAMRAIPVAFFGRPASLRADGRLMYDLPLYRVKRPEESHAPWDYYTQIGTLPAADAFLPMNPACKA
jgi:branched-chain amino acid transport system substrate-binding protein